MHIPVIPGSESLSRRSCEFCLRAPRPPLPFQIPRFITQPLREYDKCDYVCIETRYLSVMQECRMYFAFLTSLTIKAGYGQAKRHGISSKESLSSSAFNSCMHVAWATSLLPRPRRQLSCHCIYSASFVRLAPRLGWNDHLTHIPVWLGYKKHRDFLPDDKITGHLFAAQGHMRPVYNKYGVDALTLWGEATNFTKPDPEDKAETKRFAQFMPGTSRGSQLRVEEFEQSLPFMREVYRRLCRVCPSSFALVTVLSFAVTLTIDICVGVRPGHICKMQSSI